MTGVQTCALPILFINWRRIVRIHDITNRFTGAFVKSPEFRPLPCPLIPCESWKNSWKVGIMKVKTVHENKNMRNQIRMKFVIRSDFPSDLISFMFPEFHLTKLQKSWTKRQKNLVRLVSPSWIDTTSSNWPSCLRTSVSCCNAYSIVKLSWFASSQRHS